MWPQRVLVVNPNYFDVTYAINPHMSNADGTLKVDRLQMVSGVSAEFWHNRSVSRLNLSSNGASVTRSAAVATGTRNVSTVSITTFSCKTR